MEGTEEPHFFPVWQNSPPVGQSLLIIEDSWSHSDTPRSVGLLWASDQPDAETCTWQCTTITREKYQCCRRNSNPQSQQARGADSRLRPRGHLDWPEQPHTQTKARKLWMINIMMLSIRWHYFRYWTWKISGVWFCCTDFKISFSFRNEAG
jgi:hypothetical protein